MKDVLTVILGGGRGTRLYPLTKHRSEPAVPIAGKYRLIDIPISNCINSGLQRIYVLTQFLSVSLHRHIANTYKFDPFSQGFVEVLAAQQTNEAADWYEGTADAIRQNLRYLRQEAPAQVLVLCGDQVYRMNFRELLQTHREAGAHVTLAVAPVRRARAPELGVVRLDETGRIIDLVEKPQAPRQLDALRTPPGWFERRGLGGKEYEHLANMGIYLFQTEVLLDLLEARPPATDLVRELLMRALATHRIHAHLFAGYWQDVGTVRSYYEASLALTGESPPFDFHSAEGTIYTRMRNLPASRVGDARLDQCLVSDGCVVGDGVRAERSVLGVRSRVGRDVTLRGTVLIGADRYETPAEREANRRRGLPDLGVGDGSVIERAIVDKDCRIGRGVRIVNGQQVQEADGENYVIRDGIVVIPDRAVVPDGTVI
jgi:glucose-1-phosphate adenylyltransferase